MGEIKNSETYQMGRARKNWPKNWVWMRNRLHASGSRRRFSRSGRDDYGAGRGLRFDAPKSGAKVDLGRQAK